MHKLFVSIIVIFVIYLVVTLITMVVSGPFAQVANIMGS